MKPKKILLVDDSPRDTEMAIDVLQPYNLANEVTTLRDGAEALAYIPPGRVRHAKQLRSRRDSARPQDAAGGRPGGAASAQGRRPMASSREDQDLNKCYELGVNADVVKPLSFHEFIEAVKTLGAFWAVLNELPTGGSHPPLPPSPP